MRPTKLNHKVLDALKSVVDEWHNALVCTDEEICFLVNIRLEEADRISYRTFQRYKAKAKQAYEEKHYPDREDEQEPQDSPEMKQLYYALYEQIMLCHIQVKNYCMEKIQEGGKGAMHYRWLLNMRLRYWNGNSGKVNGDQNSGRIPPRVVAVRV